jgi:hypothetical protein
MARKKLITVSTTVKIILLGEIPSFFVTVRMTPKNRPRTKEMLPAMANICRVAWQLVRNLSQ